MSEVNNQTRLEQQSLPVRDVTIWTFVLNHHEAMQWDQEQLDMIEDAFWLVGQAIAGHAHGPLTLPRHGVKLRD